MIFAFIKKLLGIRSPSTLCHGYEFEYDWLKNRDQYQRQLQADIDVILAKTLKERA